MNIKCNSLVETLGSHAYADLIIDYYVSFTEERGMVSLGNLIEMMFEDVYLDIKMDLVQRAIDRNDHEIYGCTKTDFALLCYNGKIDYESITPNLDETDFGLTVRDFLIEFGLFFEDFYQQLRNVPICEVW